MSWSGELKEEISSGMKKPVKRLWIEAVLDLQREICLYLNRESRISMAQITRNAGVGTTGVALAIKGMEVARTTE